MDVVVLGVELGDGVVLVVNLPEIILNNFRRDRVAHIPRLVFGNELDRQDAGDVEDKKN